MNKWKIAFFINLGVLVVVTATLLYVIIDQGISSTYLQVSIDDQAKANKVLGKLIVKGEHAHV